MFQDAVVHAYISLPTLRSPALFAPWLRTIAYNRAMQWQRHRYREAAARPRLWRPEAEEDGARAVEARVDLVAALGLLTPRDRALIVLCDLQERTPAELSRRWQVPAGTVRVRLHRAHGALRDALTRAEAKEDGVHG